MLGVLFTGFFVLVFAYGIYEVWDMPLLARIFPLWISLIAFILSLAQLAIEARRSFAPEPTHGSEFADLAPDMSLAPGLVYGRALYYVSWLLGLYLAIWLIGFVIAMTLFIFTFLRWEAEKSRESCAVMSCCSALFLVAVSWIMTLYWPEGWLGEVLGLPWPFK
jgi:putative tricarboxylic transport membrane protein